MRNNPMSPAPLTLVSAAFQCWLEPNHILETCSPAGILVPQPVSPTRGGRNIRSLPVPTVFLNRNEIGFTELGIFNGEQSVFYFTTHPCLRLLLSRQRRANPADLGGWCVTPQAAGPNLPQVLGAAPASVAHLALGFRWLAWLSLLGIQGKLSNANVGLVLLHLKE